MLKVFLRRLVARYLGALVQLAYKIKFEFLKLEEPPIIILTPGKVGSSSVYLTLKSKVKNPVFHIHHYSIEGIKKSTKKHLNSDRKSRPLHLIISNLLRKKLENYSGDLYVITIVREPISRAISAFFQNIDFYKSEIESKGLEINEDKAKELLLSSLNEDITFEIEEWFRQEIELGFGINAFEDDFNMDKGYSISHNGNIHHLLLKMEDLDKVFSDAIHEFLYSKEKIKLQKANIGDQKHYASSYFNIKREIHLSPKQLDQIISSKYFQHFYSEKEFEVKQKWF